MNKTLQITKEEIQQYIQPILDKLQAKKIDPMGIGMFKSSAINGCMLMKLALENYLKGKLSDKSVALEAIDDAIARLATLRIMLERPEDEIYEECTTYMNATEQQPPVAWVDVEARLKAMDNDELELLSPPGAHIIESMEALGIDRPLFCIRMELTPEAAQDLLTGRMILTPYIADQLEDLFNVDAQFWLDLETNYRQKLHRLTNIKEMK